MIKGDGQREREGARETDRGTARARETGRERDIEREKDLKGERHRWRLRERDSRSERNRERDSARQGMQIGATLCHLPKGFPTLTSSAASSAHRPSTAYSFGCHRLKAAT